MSLDRTGSYLKYFGRKQDTIYIKNLLIGIRLRWKKLLRRTDERGRLLQQAYREDKRVSSLWWRGGQGYRNEGSECGSQRRENQESGNRKQGRVVKIWIFLKNILGKVSQSMREGIGTLGSWKSTHFCIQTALRIKFKKHFNLFR